MPLIGRLEKRGAALLCALLILWGLPAAGGQEDSGRQTYAKAGCDACHGPTAQGATGSALAGTKRPYPEFVEIVREGIGDMPPISEGDLSDADLDVIFKWLTQLSPKRSDRMTPKQAR